MVRNYFQDLQLCITTAEQTTPLQFMPVIGTVATSFSGLHGWLDRPDVSHRRHQETAGKLDSSVTWAGMKFKPKKSTGVIKGRLAEYRFHIKGTPIPIVSELPVKSLGRFVDADLNNSAQRDQLRKEKHQRSCQYRQGCTHGQIERMVPAVCSVPVPDVASNNLWSLHHYRQEAGKNRSVHLQKMASG